MERCNHIAMKRIASILTINNFFNKYLDHKKIEKILISRYGFVKTPYNTAL